VPYAYSSTHARSSCSLPHSSTFVTLLSPTSPTNILQARRLAPSLFKPQQCRVSHAQSPAVAEPLHAMAPITPPPEGWATTTEWQLQKPTITSLYRDQNKTLKEVMQFMAEKHNFYGSVKMYKSHIRKWGIDKNMKARDAAEIIRQQKARAALGKSSVVYIRGKRIEPSKMQQYLARASATVTTQIFEDSPDDSDSKSPPRPNFVVCRTPSPDPEDSMFIPPRLDDPNDLRVPQECMHILRNYVSGGFETGKWKLDPQIGGPDTYNSLAWLGNLNTARDLIQGKRVKQGFHLLGICLDQYKLHLREPDADFWIVTYAAAVGLGQSDAKLGDMFIDYAAKLTNVILPSNHPFTLLWARLLTLRMPGIKEHGAAVIKSYVDTCGRYFTPLNPIRTHGPQGMYYALHMLGLLSLQDFEMLSEQGYRESGVIEYGKKKVKLRQGAIAAMSSRAEEADQHCDEVSCWLDTEPKDLWSDMRLEIHWIRFQIYAPRPQEAWPIAKKLAEYCKEAYGPGHYNTAYTIATLESYFRQVGNNAAAEDLRRDFESQWKLLCKKARYFKR